MAEPTSQSLTDADLKGLEGLAKGWLSSVHAIWDPKLENRQISKDEVRFNFTDRESQQYAVLMDGEGRIKEFKTGASLAVAPSSSRSL
ncbi:MAG: hypothetical protein L0213_00950, partial [Candidatus Dadabacteria bacterium]|nr:hypothetical protein [Candidatus Dadabacteria bacterium]